MTERGRVGVRLAIAGAMVAGGALAGSGVAAAEPAPGVPIPAPGQPIPPGQPVAIDPASLQSAPVAPPLPGGPPPVPEMVNPEYGQGANGGGLGYIRDLWRAARSPDPVSAFAEAQSGGMPVGPPPGAGPAPKLPPGYTSLTAPESSTPALNPAQIVGGPALPPGFVSLSDPAPPPEVLPVGAPGAAPAGVPHPAAPPPPPAPPAAELPPTIIANQ
ncbi:hypothetical protein [Mycobacterium sp. C31M]